MCQISYYKFSSIAHTKLFTTLNIISNTFITHHDGWGIYSSVGGLFKTEQSAQLTSDIGTIVNDICKDKSPVISHVRLASVGSKISEENAHPFETKNFVLAHNGTLSIKKEFEDVINKIKEKYKKEKDIIDSEIFAICLEDGYSSEKNIVKLLNKTMSMFGGKFAFIIYCKPENIHYIIRGKTADLHYTTFISGGKVVGLVVNTEESSLNRTIHLFENSLQSVNVIVSHVDTEELDKETIYKVSGYKLTKVGELKENEKEVTTFFTRDSRTSTKTLYPTETGFSIIKELARYMNKYSLSPEDIDKMLLYTLGKGIFFVEEEDLKFFLDKIPPRITTSKKFINEIDLILNAKSFNSIPFGFYVDYGYTFPYMTITKREDQIKFSTDLRKFLKEIYD